MKVKKQKILKMRVRLTANDQPMVHCRKRIHNTSFSIKKGRKKRFFRNTEKELCTPLIKKFTFLVKK